MHRTGVVHHHEVVKDRFREISGSKLLFIIKQLMRCHNSWRSHYHSTRIAHHPDLFGEFQVGFSFIFLFTSPLASKFLINWKAILLVFPMLTKHLFFIYLGHVDDDGQHSGSGSAIEDGGAVTLFKLHEILVLAAPSFWMSYASPNPCIYQSSHWISSISLEL